MPSIHNTADPTEERIEIGIIAKARYGRVTMSLLIEGMRALTCSFAIQDSNITVRLRNELTMSVPVWAESESIDFEFK